MDTRCRICIKKASQCTSLNSKIENSSNLTFFDFLNKCTSINAYESDKLPQSLCSVCAHGIKEFYSLVKLAEKSDLILREGLKKLIATGTYNDNRESSNEEITMKNYKIKEEPEDFNEEDYHQTSETGSSLYLLDIVKEEPCVLESTSIIQLKESETKEGDKFLSNPDRTEGRIGETGNILSYKDDDLDIEHSDSEDDLAISLLKTRSFKNADEMNSQSVTSSKSFISSNVQNEAYATIDNKNEAESDIQSSNYFCCNTCHQIFKIEKDFVNHMTIVHSTRKLTEKPKGEGHFKCKLCKNTYHSHNGLWNHKRLMHNGNKKKTKYVCTICDKLFLTKRNCQDHQVVHSKKKNYACSLCFKEFTRQSSLKTHVQAHNRDGSYKCEKHKIVFKNQGEYISHCHKYNHKNRHECKICGMMFENLDIHMTVHTGENPFKCETCGKTFSLKSAYQTHLRIHTKISHPCPQCNKKYKTKRCLQSHIDKHNNSKFQCALCNKKYVYQYELKMHTKKCKLKMRKIKDAERKQFKCETCNKFFKHKSSLNIHNISNHSDVTYICNQCGKQLKSSITLRGHMKAVHNITKKTEVYYISNAELRSTKHSEVSKLHKWQPNPIETKIKIENEEQDVPEVLNKIEIKTKQEVVDRCYEATEGPVIHFYKTNNLEDTIIYLIQNTN